MIRRILIVRILLFSCLFINPGGAWAEEPAEANPQVILKTARGEMVVELFPRQAPQSVGMFLEAAKYGRYNKLRFERYADGFAIQLAQPKWAMDLPVADERKNGLSHVQGAVGLTWDYVANKCGGKVYICLATVPQPSKLGLITAYRKHKDL